MKQKLLSTMFAMTCVTSLSFAQTREVSGLVTSSDGTPISGASISVVGTNTATQTDGSGRFKISVNPGGTLNVSYIGYISQKVSIGNSTNLSIVLQSGDQTLEEVVVTGYGAVKKADFAGAAATIGPKEVENKPVANITQNLQGRLPGVLANSGSGQPGAGATITIRGIKSIQGSGAQPLYIVDGIPVSGLESLNQNDFESVTVLKDANAAALYGARGGVGVIVITTKSGKKGKSDITFRTQIGSTAPPDFSRLNLMSTEELLAYEERTGLITNSDNASFSNVPGWYYSPLNPANANLSQAKKDEYARKLDSTRNINTDISDLLFRNGLSQNYEINLQGGENNLTYFTSLGYFSQQGIDKTSDYDRYSGRFNLGYNKNKFDLKWNSNLSYGMQNNAIGDSWGNSTLNPFQMIYRAKPYDNPYLPDGTLNFGGGGTNLNLKTLANLLETAENSRWTERKWKINTGLTLSYRLTDDLVLKNTTGLDADNNLYEYYIHPDSYRGSVQTYNKGFVREASSINAQLINTTSLNFSKVFNDVHAVRAGAYFEGIRVYNKGMGFVLYNLNPSLPWTGQGANPLPTNGAATLGQNATSARSGYGIRSYFATAEYGYNDKYLVNANVRRDGTSRIANIQNREITTWSTGFVWNAIKESFVENLGFFDDLRLRATYGQTPNIGSITVNSYSVNGFSVPNYLSAQIPAFGTSSYTGSTIAGIGPSTPGNPNLKIETVNKTNIGLDLATWDSRVRFTLDLYNEMTHDLFVNQPLSNTTGFNNMAINAGKMSNKGIEALVGVDVVRSQDFDVSLGWNHSINKNKIEDLGLVSEYESGTFIIRKGLPYGSHYTYHYLGANPDDGRPMYYAQDGETVVYSVANAGRFAYFGTYLPKHVGGFNADLRYKRFSVGVLFSYQFDVVRSNNVRNWITDGTRGNTGAVNQSRELIDNQWLKPGDNKFFPSPAYAKNFTSSDLQDAKFLRLRNLNIAYNLPEIKYAGNTIVKGANLYFNAYNLAVWSPWAGTDPEDNNNISLVEYPNPKMFVFGIDFKF